MYLHPFTIINRIIGRQTCLRFTVCRTSAAAPLYMVWNSWTKIKESADDLLRSTYF